MQERRMGLVEAAVRKLAEVAARHGDTKLAITLGPRAFDALVRDVLGPQAGGRPYAESLSLNMPFGTVYVSRGES